MTQKIEQEFLINASQSFTELDKLDRAYQRFQERLLRVGLQMGGIGKGGASGLTPLSGGLKQVDRELNAVRTNADKATVSFNTLSRVIQAQVAVRAFNLLNQGIAQSVVDAGELQKQFALIATIATSIETPGGQRRAVPTDDIARGAREISDSLNIPQLEVAEGLYNAISNQVGTFGETLLFTAESAKLARATNSSLADSVDAISAVMLSYNLNADQASNISDILFTTIDKGRVTADKLGNSLGRILPAAAELGVGFDEVGASVAAVSVKGLTTSETLTQVRATFSGLIKPSEALKQAFNDIGVASGEAGVQQFGFVGLLEKLRQTSGKTAEDLANLFPNVRNLGAVLALTGENLKAYEDTLADIRNAQGASDKAFSVATATDIEVITNAVNKLRNSFVTVGADIIKTGASLTEFTGLTSLSSANLDRYVGAFSNVGIKLAATAAGLLVVTKAMQALNAAALANPFVAGAAAGIGIGTAISSLIESARASDLAKFTDQLDKLSKTRLDALTKSVKEYGEESDQIFKATNQGVKVLLSTLNDGTREYERAMVGLIDSNEAFETSTKEGLEQFLSVRESYLSGLRQAAGDAERLMLASRNKVKSIQSEQDEIKFERSIRGLKDVDLAFQLVKRSSTLAARARDEFNLSAKSGDADGLARAQDALDRAKAAASEAEAIGVREGNRQLEVRAASKLNSLLNSQIDSERTLQALQADRAKKANDEANRQAKIVAELKRQAKVVVENSSLFDSDGQRFSPSEQARRASKRDTALSDILARQLDREDINIADILGVASLRNKTQAELAGVTAEVSTELVDGGQQLRDQVTSALSAFNAQLGVQLVLDINGTTEPLTPEGVGKALADIENKLKLNRNEGSELLTATQGRMNALANAREALASVEASFNSTVAQQGGGDRSDAGLQKQIKQLRAFIVESRNAIAEIEASTNANADEIRDRLRPLIENFAATKSVFSQGTLQQTAELTLAFATKFRELVTQAELLKKLQAEAGNNMIDPQALIDLGSLLDKQRGIADETERTLRAQEMLSRLRSSSPSLRDVGGNYAGHVYFNNGGLNRGVDTISAKLAPGESVLNARATSRMFSQFQALNAGQMPVFRASTGAVTNVGDINITVPGQATNAASGREIANALRRELRRGTSRL